MASGSAKINQSRVAMTVTAALERPSLDDREYRVITLPNQLEALLINDATTDKASAALDVNVGSYSDPDELPGLAHFLEHLLFMGTEKYPSENEYSQYLSDHAGRYNAYTSSERTNYFFEIAHEYLEGALDRFAQFFVAPLFKESCQDREVLAVDSENKKNLQSDLWRLHQLDRALSSTGHPYSKFSTGNLETLGTGPKSRGIDIRRELLAFYERYYSANIMKLVVIGREPLDQLEDWVVSRFSAVPNGNKSPPAFSMPVLTPSELGKLVRAKPIMDSKNVSLTFPVPDQSAYYESKPANFFSHLIGHEGPGSLLHHFKEQKWALSLEAGSQHVSEGTDFFLVHVELTELGLEHYEDIVVGVFEYIEMLKRQMPPEKWIFDELQAVSEANFKFRQKADAADTTSRLAAAMQKPGIPRERLLSQSLFREFRPDLIQEFLGYLNPDNFRVSVTAQSLEGLDKTEKWYGTEYSVSDLSASLRSRVASASPSAVYRLPGRNEFIPTNFDVVKREVTDKLKHPTLVRKTDSLRVWHKKDDTFWVPKAEVRVRMKNPVAQSTPLNSVKTKLFMDLVADALVEFAYDAEVAGLNYAVDVAGQGLEINAYGYNHKLAVLLERILDKFKTLEVDSNRFAVIKERYGREMRNFGYEVPYRQMGHYSAFLLNDHSWSVKDKLAQLYSVDADALRAFVPELRTQMDLEILAVGNLTKEEALRIADRTVEILDPKPLAASQRVAGRSFLLSPGSSHVYDVLLDDPDNVNSCVDFSLMTGRLADRQLVNRGQLFSQIIKEPAFNQLRTKEQLGYVAGAISRATRTTHGIRLYVQSERTADYLESRIENFLDKTVSRLLANMTEAEFKAHVEALVAIKLEKKKNIREEAYFYWHHVTNGYYNFPQPDTDAEILRSLSKQDIVDFYNTHVSPKSPTRSKLVVNLRSHSPPAVADDRRLTAVIVNAAHDRDLDWDDGDFADFSKACDGHNADEIFAKLPAVLEDKNLSSSEIQSFVTDVKAAYASLAGSGRYSLPDADKRVVIDDVGLFKSTQALTEAPYPLQDLSVYMENEAKL